MSEWGPWIEHDGRGMPDWLVGAAALVVTGDQSGRVGLYETTIRKSDAPAFDWRNFGLPSDVRGKPWKKVLRYRIRRPSALIQLERIAADPQPVREKEDA